MPIFLIAFENATKHITVGRLQSPKTWYYLIFKVSFESHSIRGIQYPFPLPKSLNELPLINSPIFPSILTFSMGLALHVSAFIIITVRKGFLSKAVL